MNPQTLSADRFPQALPPSFEQVLSARLEPSPNFVELASRFSDEPGTVALLSGGSHDSARWNILGIRPWLVLKERDGMVEVAANGETSSFVMDPFEALDAVSRRFALPTLDAEHPLSAGLLGYLAYDLKDVLEDLPRTSRDDLGLPRLWMCAPSILVVQDRHDGSTTVHVPVRDVEDSARSILTEFVESLARPAPGRASDIAAGTLVSGLTRDEYMSSVEAIREYIARGHVYQVNMSQRFETGFQGDAFTLFAKLFEANPAPFFAFVQAGDHQIVSTSPERFVELRGRKVETRPIKGTRPRGRTPEEDAVLRRDLENSPKDDSELSMIVDLLRNDIGRACAAGSVHVLEHKRVEAYENVHHLVSVVEGELDEGKSAVDLLRATFPGGSITGCPKIRSMEVIDELEPVRRHVYTGSIGYLGFGGTMDLNIAIRTATITDGRLVYSVGGGVVYDSDPADEFEETLHKGRTISNALTSPGGASPTPPDPRIGWMDGKFLAMPAMTLSVEEEGFAYGCGFFETVRVQSGRPLRLESHLERFGEAWRTFVGDGFPDVGWKDVIALLVEKNRLGDRTAAVKILASAGRPGTGARGMRLMATVRPYVHRLEGTGREGLRLAVYPHGRQSPLADHKTTNYLLQRTAALWAKERGADEAILLNADGSVSETNTANLLCRIGGRWVRPASAHVLPGTMEKALLELLDAWGESVETRPVAVAELKTAQCVLVTNALMGAVSAMAIDGVALGPDVERCRRINEVLLG